MKAYITLALSLLALTACAAETDVVGEPLAHELETDAPEATLESLRQNVRNGELGFAENETTGVVRFWIWNSVYREWRNTCSGTLITNNKVATARHCLEPTAESRSDGYPVLLPWGTRPWDAIVTHASTIANISAVSLAPNGHDAAVLTLSSNVPVVVGTTRYTTGYKRPLYPVYNTMHFVAAFGLTTLTAEPSSICAQGTRGCWYDRRPMSTMWGYPTPHSLNSHVILPYDSATGRTIDSGDSGSGLLLLFNGAPSISALPLVGIFSHAGTFSVGGVLKSGGAALRIDAPNVATWVAGHQR